MVQVLGQKMNTGAELWMKMVVGITSLSIILSGYGIDVTPEDLRQKYFPVLDNEKISETLTKEYRIKNSDFLYASAYFSPSNLKKYLEEDKPILICLWDKPKNNRWTSKSHYMVLLATDGKDMVYVSNPNGLENDSKSSGWYNFDEITPYIAKVLFIEE